MGLGLDTDVLIGHPHERSTYMCLLLGIGDVGDHRARDAVT